jgi:hypothetical protein
MFKSFIKPIAIMFALGISFSAQADTLTRETGAPGFAPKLVEIRT